MAKKGPGITHIDINFNLKRLIRVLESAPDDFFLDDRIKPSLYKGVAKHARGKILKGNLRKLKPNTVKIRQKQGQMPPVPLFRTGKMQKSITAKKDGVYVEGYGIDHLEGYTIRAGSDEFTRHWKRDVHVPPRNYLPDSGTIELSKKDSKHIYNKINRLIKYRGR